MKAFTAFLCFLVLPSLMGQYAATPPGGVGQVGGSSMTGFWKSTSGNVFAVMVYKNQIDIVLTTPDQKKHLILGRWRQGAEGRQFDYWFPGAQSIAATVILVPQNLNQLKVVDGKGQTFWWQRLQ